MSDYLPTNEADLKTFATNFAALILAEPATYGLVANDATQIDNAAKDYASKYDLALSPPTRTAASINAKNAAKLTVTAILRGYAMQIKSNRAVSDQAKINLRIGVYNLTRTPVPPPDTRPLISVVSVDVLRHELRFADTPTPDKSAKPDGAAGLQFFCQVGDAAPADPLTCRFQAFLSKMALKMDFAPADAGKTAFYFARWQTATGKVGPFSLVISRPVAG